MDEEEQFDLAEAIDANIGANFKDARERLGISQAELAKLAKEAGLSGFHQTTIARIESGKRSLKASEAVAFTRLLETSLEYLAESTETARLRGYYTSLRGVRNAFDAAVRDAVFQRLWVAAQLDAWLPYGGDGRVPYEELIKANVDLHLYEQLEELLVNSDPVERLDHILRVVLYDVRKSQEAREHVGGGLPKQREQFLIEELVEEVEGENGEHPEAS